MKIIVSLPTFNEIASLIEKEGNGAKINDGKGGITLEKGTAIMPPIDFRLVQMRQNCADIAAKCNPSDLVEASNKLYEFVLNGKVDSNQNTIKIEQKSPTNKPEQGW